MPNHEFKGKMYNDHPGHFATFRVWKYWREFAGS